MKNTEITKKVIREHHKKIGALGGNKTKQRGPEYYAKIGKLGNIGRLKTLAKRKINN